MGVDGCKDRYTQKVLICLYICRYKYILHAHRDADVLMTTSIRRKKSYTQKVLHHHPNLILCFSNDTGCLDVYVYIYPSTPIREHTHFLSFSRDPFSCPLAITHSLPPLLSQYILSLNFSHDTHPSSSSLAIFFFSLTHSSTPSLANTHSSHSSVTISRDRYID